MHLMIGRSAITAAFVFALLATAAPAAAASCSVSPQALTLGSYDPFATAPQDAVTGIAISCDVETSVVIAIGPSTASMISASEIAAAGRARQKPPPVPRVLSISPPADRRLTSFCTVGNGSPVSSASCVALSRPDEPQCRAAADIITTA